MMRSNNHAAMKLPVLVLAIILLIESCRSFTALPALSTKPPSLHHPIASTIRQPEKSFFTSPNRKQGQQKQQQYQQAPHQRMNSLQPLMASPIVSVLSSPVGSLLVLASIVLVHECGHYFAARSFNISVEEFSVGVGPKVFGFNAFGNDFSLRALPLGGYVKFPENYNTTSAREIDVQDEKAFENYIQQQDVGLGTQLLNAITFGAVLDNMWSNEKERLKRVAALESKTPKPWWQASGNKDSSVSIPDKIEYYTDPSLLQNRPWPERAVVLSGGVAFNLLLAFAIYFGQINFGTGLPQPTFNQGIAVTAAPRPEAAANGLLQRGDVIIGVNGIPINSLSQSPTQLESQKAISNFISTIRATPDGEVLQLDVLRGDRTSPMKVSVQPKRASTEDSSRNNKNESPQAIGVLLAPNFKNMENIKASSPIEAAGLAANYVSSVTQQTASGILSFFSSFVSGSGSGGNSISGPIGLIKAGSEIVATRDLGTVLLFAAAISINLGVVNALPIPALDGGQLLFVFAEALTGKKVNQRIEEGVTGVAVLFLLLLTVSTLFGDVSSIFSGS